MQRFIAILFSIFFADASAAQPSECSLGEKIETMQASGQFTFKGPFTVEELEREHLIEIRETGELLAFGYMNKSWNGLKERLQPGDEIYFRRFEEGRFFQEDHILVRKGCVIFTLPGRIA